MRKIFTPRIAITYLTAQAHLVPERDVHGARERREQELHVCLLQRSCQGFSVLRDHLLHMSFSLGMTRLPGDAAKRPVVYAATLAHPMPEANNRARDIVEVIHGCVRARPTRLLIDLCRPPNQLQW